MHSFLGFFVHTGTLSLELCYLASAVPRIMSFFSTIKTCDVGNTTSIGVDALGAPILGCRPSFPGGWVRGLILYLGALIPKHPSVFP